MDFPLQRCSIVSIGTGDILGKKDIEIKKLSCNVHEDLLLWIQKGSSKCRTKIKCEQRMRVQRGFAWKLASGL